tara:strand:+ start:66 stop:599 length:534 start_codon:yes stop_codon:yes gene_type:complete
MKLLPTIVLVLISVSTYSQVNDSTRFFKYENSSFFLNGEIIEMKDMKRLTRSYQTGKNNLANGIASLNTVKYPVTRIPLFLGGASAILVGPIIAVLGSYDPSGPVSASNQFIALAMGGYCIVVGGAIILTSFSSNKKFMKGADKQLQKVADKLNEAIHQQGIDKLQKVMGHGSLQVS